MSEITLIGIDLAKNIFRINCLDENGKRVMNKNLHRESVVQFLRRYPNVQWPWKPAQVPITGDAP